MESVTLTNMSEASSLSITNEKIDAALKNLCILKFGKQVGLQKFDSLMGNPVGKVLSRKIPKLKILKTENVVQQSDIDKGKCSLVSTKPAGKYTTDQNMLKEVTINYKLEELPKSVNSDQSDTSTVDITLIQHLWV